MMNLQMSNSVGHALTARIRDTLLIILCPNNPKWEPSFSLTVKSQAFLVHFNVELRKCHQISYKSYLLG